MSGTSLDGLDIACCRFEGAGFDTKCTVEAFETVPLPPLLAERLAAVIRSKNAALEEITLLNAQFGTFCGQAVASFIQRHHIEKNSVSLVVSHGQTIFHAPGRRDDAGLTLNTTLQIGDGDHVAAACGIPVLCDLRQKHVASGREGAPLAVYLDVLLFGRRNTLRVLLNLGGISNITVIDFRGETPEIVSTDCGPANTLLDGFTQRAFNLPFDASGRLSAGGMSNAALLKNLKTHPFFGKPFPKSTGREEFHQNWLDEMLAAAGLVAPADVLATLADFTAWSVAEAVTQTVPSGAGALLVSGGGVHNFELMRRIAAALPSWQVQPVSVIDPDAKEAVLFALLGNEYLKNPAGTYPWGPAALGKLCLP